MEKKALKIPCSWEERKPCLIDRVFFVPSYYDKHHLFSENLFLQNRMFKEDKPIILEYCSGNGEWIIQKAKAHPDIHWIAVEMRLDRVKKIYSKLQNHNLENLFIIYGEGFTFSKYYIPDNALSSVFINFPDPWPKKRHAKHRLMNEEFVEELSRTVQPLGKLFFVTDDSDSVDRVKSVVFQQKSSWHSLYDDPYYVNSWQDYGSSYFDGLWRQKGRQIHYMQMENRKASLLP
jgi:tRNA (guanine-N7-)-methyltransferase